MVHPSYLGHLASKVYRAVPSFKSTVLQILDGVEPYYRGCPQCGGATEYNMELVICVLGSHTSLYTVGMGIVVHLKNDGRNSWYIDTLVLLL